MPACPTPFDPSVMSVQATLPLAALFASSAPDSDAFAYAQSGAGETVAPSDPIGGPAAPGEEGALQAPGGSSFLLPMLAVGAIFWFVMIGPERKQRKKRAAMLTELTKGTKVMTTSGMIATVVQVQDDEVTLQAAEGVRLRFTLQAIQSVVDGSAKAADKSD